jgi:recombination protein RecT|tara:strand:- start:685 stop:1584 length:900 start_codon:yes stop_codon:yes gene_type:complete
MTTALSTRDKVTALNQYLESKKSSLVKIAPRGTDVDRIIRVAMFEAVKNEKIVQCSPTSVYMALAKACELDLVAGGVLHRASLVPMWNKRSKTFEAELWIEYTGLMDLVKRSGEVAHFAARVVHENDEFEHCFALEGGEVLKHKVNYDDPGELKLAYAVCFFKDGQRQVEVMRKDQINRIRQGSRSPDSGPWAQHTEEMWRKTVIRRICKYLPLTPKTTAVLEHDIKSDFEDNRNFEDFTSTDVDAKGNTGNENDVIDVQASKSKPAPKRASKVKDLVERTKTNNLPEPEEDFTSQENE